MEDWPCQMSGLLNKVFIIIIIIIIIIIFIIIIVVVFVVVVVMVVVVVIIILACTLPLLYKHILKRMYRINAIVRHQVEPLTQKELVKTVITFCKMCQRTMSVLV